MLTIREEQIQHFIAKDDSELVELIVRTIQQANPERISDYDDEKLEAMVKIGIERAKTYELKRAEDIAAFVAVMFEVAPNFDEQEEIKILLEDRNLSASERFFHIWERTSDEIWEKAEQGYKASVWFPE